MAGPPSPSFIFGNFHALVADSSLTSQWRRQFGRNFRFRLLFGRVELHTSDIKAVARIVTNGSIYNKTPSNLNFARDLLGNGLLSVEGEEHKRQRRIMNPAFAPMQIRALTEVYVEKAIHLRDVWAHQVADNPDGVVLDVSGWFRRVTLAVIGQAGFNYEFNALASEEEKEESNPLNKAFNDLQHSPQSQLYARFRTVQAVFPALKILPVPGSQVMSQARAVMRAISGQIISTGKAEVVAADSKEETPFMSKRDVISLLLKSNLSADVPETHRMSDRDMAAQIPTLLFAGQETTSAVISWTLHVMSLQPRVQTKLRDELLSLDTDNPTTEELNGLPYLECVVRETLRLYPPVPYTQRVATQDDVLPLAEPWMDLRGEVHENLLVPKGQILHVPIRAVNTDPEIWGPDALEFVPERWDALPEAISAIPGVYAHLLTFFGGTHNCIGYRFALLEIKAILYAVVRAFEFTPAIPKERIVPQALGLIHRPAVVGEDKSQISGLPLVVRAYNHEA
ncbi:cytochrome P450 [Roridomyces roridus]|uniref:Cytochrome P450 n=1 Tax=Roridomyces roridus TaxID=1738132 RepID=A0AAD7B4E9_9AGAR|nr:cytochrome P450 [Roridomyces roridus]